MKRFPFLLSALILCASLLLQGCSGGSHYGGSPWQYQTTPRQAINPPSALDGTDASSPVSPLEGGEAGSQALMPLENLAPVKVGIILPLSGRNAELGQAMLNASQMALFEVGHNAFELIPRDTKGTAEGARSAAQDAIQQGAQLILGPIFAEEVRAAKGVTRSAGVNMIAFSTDWTLADNATYLMGFMPFDQVNRVLGYSASQGINTIGVFAPSGGYGDAVVNAHTRIAPQLGINTAKITRFAANGADIPARMQDFTQQNPQSPYQAILMPVGGDLAKTVARTAAQHSLSPAQVRRIGTGLWDDPMLAYESALEGGWFAGPSPAMRQRFEGRYRETFGVTPPRLSTLAYDATALAAVLARNGLQQTGKPAFTSTSIQNANGYAGIDGIFRFREGGLAERGLAVLEFNRGQIRIIDQAPHSFQHNTQ